MRTHFSKLLIAGLAGLMLSGQAFASPRFMDGGFVDFSISQERIEREYGKRDEREARKGNRKQERKEERKADEREHERGYGYGYERRNHPQRQDDRGRQ